MQMLKKHLLSLFLLVMVGTMVQAENFQTQWNIPANTTSITFNALTSGSVHYNLGTNDSGNFTKTTAGSVTITFAPSTSNRSLLLSIEPQNLRRFYMGNGTNASQLTGMWVWGDVPWSSMSDMFLGCNNMGYFAVTAPNLSGFLGFLLGYYLQISAQQLDNPRIVDLKTQLENHKKNETNKVNILTDIAYEYNKVSPLVTGNRLNFDRF